MGLWNWLFGVSGYRAATPPAAAPVERSRRSIVAEQVRNGTYKPKAPKPAPKPAPQKRAKRSEDSGYYSTPDNSSYGSSYPSSDTSWSSYDSGSSSYDSGSSSSDYSGGGGDFGGGGSSGDW